MVIKVAEDCHLRQKSEVLPAFTDVQLLSVFQIELKSRLAQKGIKSTCSQYLNPSAWDAKQQLIPMK